MEARTLAAVRETLSGAGLLTDSRGDMRTEVTGASQDSRMAGPGELFLAWRGADHDAHDHLPAAVDRGARAAIVERWLADVAVPQLLVSDGRRAAAVVAFFLAGRPDRRLFTVGITGTNGKTTTSLMARHLLCETGSAAAIGTVGVIGAPEPSPEAGSLTTPGPVEMADTLRILADSGTRSVVMEASSHALDQRRLDGIEFDVGVFTNLSRDHLDYHGDRNSYLAAKARLAHLVKANGTLVVNADDPAWAALQKGSRALTTYSAGSDALPTGSPAERANRGASATLRAESVTLFSSGSSFNCVWRGERIEASLPLPGDFNVANALAALAVAESAGIEPVRAVKRLARMPQVPGRMETVISEPFSVVVDFAHTPDALRNALIALRRVTQGRLMVVFGAGGDRDPGKRRPMGAEAAKLADLVVLTSDNPRGEDPERILDDIAVGLDGAPHQREADRGAAIALAIERARPGDTVLLAGKGHETYQESADGKVPFDERELARAAFAARTGGLP